MERGGAPSFHLGEGIQFGDSGLHIGGFTTVELITQAGEPTEVEVEGLNLLVLYQPHQALRAFLELEIGPLLVLDSESWEVTTDISTTVDRLFADWGILDALNLRLGKFRTPIGRWNLVSAEPFVWTASEPVLVARAFDEMQNGCMLFGTLYPASKVLGYTVYGQLFDPLQPDSTPPPADRGIGARAEIGTTLDEWSLAGSVLASKRGADRHLLLGIDGRWRDGKTEITGELAWANGQIEERRLWGVYVQGVREIVPLLNAVGRFEHFAPRESTHSNIVDFGFAWQPKPFLLTKMNYRLVDHADEEAMRGLNGSIALLF